MRPTVAGSNLWFQGRVFRYGMLVVAVVLLASAVWSFAHGDVSERMPAGNIVVAGMLLVNHLVSSFLPLARQQAIRVPWLLFTGLCLAYVFGSIFGVI